MDYPTQPASLKRRASESEADQVLALIQQNNTRIPPPLPYLPSDYIPSPDSPRHIVLATPALTPHGKRQRSRSIGYPLVIENAPSGSGSGSSSSSSRAITYNNNREHFELVPYREWTIIARNSQRGQLVLYNRDDQTVSVQTYVPDHHFPGLDTAGLQIKPEDQDNCPYCHRPMPAMPKEKMNASDYMDRNYFRLLASSQANTAANSPVQSRSSTFSTDTNKPHSIGAQNLNENAFNQGYYSNFFVELNKLGKGFRGSVFLCEHVLDGVKLGKYAIKKVAIGNNHPWLVRMLREVHLLERLRHPNIVSYKHSWLEYNRLTAFGPEVPCLFILMECANGGNLEEYLEFANKPTEQQEQEAQDSSKQKQKKSSKELKRERIRKQYQAQESFEKEHDVLQTQSENKRLLTMTEIWSLFLDIVQGLAHLHQQNIVHRDLKPPNLLLQYDERNSHARQGIPRVLISDFGECEDLDDDQIDNNRTGATGTLEFMAPEHVRLDPRGRNTVDYSPKADMWSLGMVLYFLCYSRLPYSVIDDVDILRTEILSFQEVWFPNSRLDIYKSDKARYTESSNNPSIVNDIPNELKILIRMLLSIDPSKRPSCNEILSKLRSLRRDNNIPFDWPSPTTTTTATKSSSSPVPTASPTASTSKTALPPHLQPFIVEAEEVINSKEDLPFVETNKRSPIHSPEVQHSSTLRKRQRLFGHEEDSDGDVIMSDIEQDTSKTRLLLGSPDLVEASSSSWLTDRQVMLLLKTTTALFKVASCTYSCSPYSTNPAILYPVVFLAMLDFWSESHSPSLILLTLHIIWIMTTTLFSGLCEA